MKKYIITGEASVIWEMIIEAENATQARIQAQGMLHNEAENGQIPEDITNVIHVEIDDVRKYDDQV